MELAEIDAAIAAVKDRQDPAVAQLVRAAEAMRRDLCGVRSGDPLKVSTVLHLYNGLINPLSDVSLHTMTRLLGWYAEGSQREVVLNGSNGVTTRFPACDIVNVEVSRIPLVPL